MPIHIYPQKLYDIHTIEIRNLITDLNNELDLKIIDDKMGTKIVRLEKDIDHVIDLVFLEIEKKYILNYIEIRMIRESEYRNTISKIKQHILTYKIDWI